VFVEGAYSALVSTDAGTLRIGEFARRVGVSPELLRAWEQRYGLLQPIRSEGGFRLYTAQDAERVARMKRGLEDGLSAAEAARRALAQAHPAEGLLDDAQDRLLSAVRAHDEATAHAALAPGSHGRLRCPQALVQTQRARRCSFENRQRCAGTRRVREVERARIRAEVRGPS
jgi:DNA-binding transcriptional MerR regulator